MLDSIAELTPKAKQANLLGHDDSGYDCLGSASKVLDQPDATKSSELYDAQKIRNILESCSSSISDEFWVKVTHYLMVVMVVASMCYIIMMGDKGGMILRSNLEGRGQPSSITTTVCMGCKNKMESKNL
eukprot:TRINITY_DN24787_c0_g1_i1.p1 TRINITY_DN24787_c0_g1~~TRINITY_DN24787_c0_g1_i1.p1  ORF type:complete len:129 (-),score=34.72 TRINITY_DN24787_c0_g1_i1:9-395(-)